MIRSERRVPHHDAHELRHLLIAQLRAIQEAGPAVNADHRNRPRLEMHIRSTDLDAGLPEIEQREPPLLDVNLRPCRLAVQVGVLNNLHGFGLQCRHAVPSV